VRLDWRVTDADLRSLRRAHEILGAELRHASLGRFDAHLDVADEEWPKRVTGGYHHMGTTRMHTDARRGVPVGFAELRLSSLARPVKVPGPVPADSPSLNGPDPAWLLPPHRRAAPPPGSPGWALTAGQIAGREPFAQLVELLPFKSA